MIKIKRTYWYQYLRCKKNFLLLRLLEIFLDNSLLNFNSFIKELKNIEKLNDCVYQTLVNPKIYKKGDSIVLDRFNNYIFEVEKSDQKYAYTISGSKLNHRILHLNDLLCKNEVNYKYSKSMA